MAATEIKTRSLVQIYMGAEAHRIAKIAAATEGVTLREWLDRAVVERAGKTKAK